MYLKHFVIKTGKDILIRFPKKVVRSFEYLSEFKKFKALADGRFEIAFKNVYPCLTDKLQFTPFDSHYTYHPAWAARKIAEYKPTEHVDISSILGFATIVSAFVPVKFFDYRPATLHLPGMSSGFADLKQLPFKDRSVESLSCMHTIEHIGLGRYGDEMDPQGDLKAINELKRVLSQNGQLLFVTPVGKPKIEFNAHRIYSYEQILEFFHPLKLKEFTMVTDQGALVQHADPKTVALQNYGCGCFWFEKLSL